MAPSSTPVHFRNAPGPSRNWRCLHRSKMITVRDLVGLLFCPKSPRAVEISARTMRTGTKIRQRWFTAVCALALISVVPVSAHAQQDSAANASTTKPATPKKTTTPTATKSSSSSSALSHRTASTTHSTSRRRKKSARARGQQKIDSERAEAIQEALIREHYLSGTPTGEWNAASEAAMRKYQADHGWQSIVVPDSRALIKLGLGPSKDKLLNPDSAMTTVPDAPKTDAPKTDPAPATPHDTAPSPEPASPAAPPSTPAQSGPPSPQ